MLCGNARFDGTWICVVHVYTSKQPTSSLINRKPLQLINFVIRTQGRMKQMLIAGGGISFLKTVENNLCIFIRMNNSTVFIRVTQHHCFKVNGKFPAPAPSAVAGLQGCSSSLVFTLRQLCYHMHSFYCILMRTVISVLCVSLIAQHVNSLISKYPGRRLLALWTNRGPVRVKGAQSNNIGKYRQIVVSFYQKPSNGKSWT